MCKLIGACTRKNISIRGIQLGYLDKRAVAKSSQILGNTPIFFFIFFFFFFFFGQFGILSSASF